MTRLRDLNLLVSRDDERAIKPSPVRQRATDQQRAKIADGMRAYIDGVRKARSELADVAAQVNAGAKGADVTAEVVVPGWKPGARGSSS